MLTTPSRIIAVTFATVALAAPPALPSLLLGRPDARPRHRHGAAHACPRPAQSGRTGRERAHRAGHGCPGPAHPRRTRGRRPGPAGRGRGRRARHHRLRLDRRRDRRGRRPRDRHDRRRGNRAPAPALAAPGGLTRRPRTRSRLLATRLRARPCPPRATRSCFGAGTSTRLTSDPRRPPRGPRRSVCARSVIMNRA